MAKIPTHIAHTLQRLQENYLLVDLECVEGAIDFTSNDYLGVVHHQLGEEELKLDTSIPYGATGSRLLAGNSETHVEFEKWLAEYYKGEAALVFNSGYVANTGLLDSVVQRHDIILYDELIHASLRDGCRISNAPSHSFKHNDLEDLARKIAQYRTSTRNIYVLVESLYSMDGDSPDIDAVCQLCDQENVFLIVDEAHSTGIMGEFGEGLVVERGLQDKVFARIYTFGKAIGRKGAVIVAAQPVIRFLINRCRTFIYSTALSPMDIIRIKVAMQHVKEMHKERSHLKFLSNYANTLFSSIPGISYTSNDSPIKPLLIGGETATELLVKILRLKDINARIIISPVVAKGTERIRVVLHSFNTTDEIDLLYNILTSDFVQSIHNGVESIGANEIANIANPCWKDLMLIERQAI